MTAETYDRGSDVYMDKEGVYVTARDEWKEEQIGGGVEKGGRRTKFDQRTAVGQGGFISCYGRIWNIR
jgi:hypothetical protein